MYIFLIISLPLAFLFFVFGLTRTTVLAHQLRILPFIFGVSAGILFAVIQFFFVLAQPVLRYNFFLCFIRLFLVQTIIPLVTIGLLFLLLTQSQFLRQIQVFITMLWGFYCVFLPLKVLHASDTVSGFSLFLKPILFVCMFLQLFWLTKVLLNTPIAFTSKCLALFGLLVLVLAWPAVTETFYYLFASLFLSLFFAVISVCLTILTLSGKIESGSLFAAIKNRLKTNLS